jgi:3-oxoacyl-[acyl-carrier protein] reductase
LEPSEKEIRTLTSLTKNVAIVTRAPGGIGHAVAERLADQGATVVVNYGTSADKAKTVVGIESKGGKAVAMQADMREAADAGRLVRDTVQRFGDSTSW